LQAKPGQHGLSRGVELKLEAEGAENPDHGDVVRRRLARDLR